MLYHKTILTLFFFFTTFHQSIAQQESTAGQALDSLIQFTKEERNDSAKARLYVEIAKQLKMIKADSARAYCVMAESITEDKLTSKSLSAEDRIVYINLQAHALFERGIINQMHYNLSGAEGLYLRAIELYAQTQNDKKLSNIYNYISRIYQWQGDQQQFYNYTAKAYQVQKRLNDTVGQAMSLIAFGAYYERQGNSDSCIATYERSLVLLRAAAVTEPLTYGLNEYGYVLQRMEKYEEAIDILFEVLAINEKGNEYYESSKTMSAIGGLFSGLEEYAKAEEYLNKALELSRKIENKAIEASVISKLGLVYAGMGDHKKSLEHHLMSYELYEEVEPSPVVIALLLNNIGKQYHRLGKPKEAIPYFEEALSMGLEKSLPKNRAMFQANLSEVYLEVGELSKAKTYATNAFQISKDIQSSQIKMRTSNILYQINKLQGQHHAALKHFESYAAIRDSLNSVDNQTALVKKESQYQLDKKEQQIITLEKEKEIQKLTLANQHAQLTRQRQNILFLILGFISLAGIVFLLFNRYRLKKTNTELLLEARQLELERETEKTLQQLELAEFRSDFFTNISHEIRTPLTLILGPLNQIIVDPTSDHTESLRVMQKNGDYLLDLINGTLNNFESKQEASKLQLEQVSIGVFLSSIVTRFAVLAKSKSLSIRLDDGTNNISVEFDRRKMETVIANLLINAITYSDRKGSVLISIRERKDTVDIKVQDFGKGIPKNSLDRIFDKGYRVSNNGQGNGIGLALCKQLVEQHAGSITVASKEQEGTVFTVNIPMKQLDRHLGEASYTQLDRTNEVIPAKKTVLIVEDNDEMRHYVRDIMSVAYNVIEAVDGEQGMLQARDKAPDLIISDVMMPKASGTELTTNLKNDILTSHIPIVLLTAKSSVGGKIEGLESGADAYITKPFRADELTLQCKNLLRHMDILRARYAGPDEVTPESLTSSEIDQRFLQQAIDIVKDNIDNSDFSVTFFCRELALNRSGVHVKLKALTGKNTTQFIKSVKLKKAAELTVRTAKSMTEIASVTGFNSRQAFNKAFKDEFGVTPSMYRNRVSGKRIATSKTTNEEPTS